MEKLGRKFGEGLFDRWSWMWTAGPVHDLVQNSMQLELSFRQLRWKFAVFFLAFFGGL